MNKNDFHLPESLPKNPYHLSSAYRIFKPGNRACKISVSNIAHSQMRHHFLQESYSGLTDRRSLFKTCSRTFSLRPLLQLTLIHLQP